MYVYMLRRICIILLLLFIGVEGFASYKQSLVVWSSINNPTYSYPVITTVTNVIPITNIVLVVTTNRYGMYYRYDNRNTPINIRKVGWVVATTNLYYTAEKTRPEGLSVLYFQYKTNRVISLVRPVVLVTNNVFASNYYVLYRGIQPGVYIKTYRPIYGTNYLCKDVTVGVTNYFAVAVENGHIASGLSMVAKVYVTTNMPALVMWQNGRDLMVSYPVGGPDSMLEMSTNLINWDDMGMNMFNFRVDTSLYPSAYFRLRRVEK